MSIYHLSVNVIGRAAGRSATGAAAYRAGVDIHDDRTNLDFNYSRRSGVASTTILLPENAPEWARDRSRLWNAAEAAENRKDSRVAREIVLALPSELPAEERQELAESFARELITQHGFAADVCIHEPDKDGDERNHHAHILLSTRRLTAAGFGEKTTELDEKISGPKVIEDWRQKWETHANTALEAAGLACIDRRTLRAQQKQAFAEGRLEDAAALDRAPTVHLGPAATAMQRRGEATSRQRVWSPVPPSMNHAAAAAERDREQARKPATGREIHVSRPVAAPNPFADEFHDPWAVSAPRISERRAHRAQPQGPRAPVTVGGYTQFRNGKPVVVRPSVQQRSTSEKSGRSRVFAPASADDWNNLPIPALRQIQQQEHADARQGFAHAQRRHEQAGRVVGVREQRRADNRTAYENEKQNLKNASRQLTAAKHERNRLREDSQRVTSGLGGWIRQTFNPTGRKLSPIEQELLKSLELAERLAKDLFRIWQKAKAEALRLKQNGEILKLELERSQILLAWASRRLDNARRARTVIHSRHAFERLPLLKQQGEIAQARKTLQPERPSPVWNPRFPAEPPADVTPTPPPVNPLPAQPAYQPPRLRPPSFR